MIADLPIELGWKSALACVVALLASLALRGRPAAQRVAVLRVGTGVLLSLPILILTVPAIEIAALPAAAPPSFLPAMAEVGALPVAASPVVPAIDWVALAYLGGAAFVLLRLAVGLFLLHRWTRQAVPASHPVWREVFARAAEPLRRPVRLLVSPRIASPLSLGVVPATILIGPDIEQSPDRAAAVIAHEMAHVRRFDWLAMLVGRFALALFWFNPLAWLLVAELARQSELAADEEAVTHVARADYAQTLLAVAGGRGAHAACGMAVTRSAMARRIRRVLDAAPRKPASGLACAALIAAIPLGIAPLAAMQIVARPDVSPSPSGKAAEPQSAPAARPPESAVRKRAAQVPPGLARRRGKPARVMPAARAEAMPRQSHALPEAPAEKRRVLPPLGLAVPSADLGAAPRDDGSVEQRLVAVGRLRAAALEYRGRARNPGLTLDIRQGYRNVAASLADEADKIEKQAQQIAGRH